MSMALFLLHVVNCMSKSTTTQQQVHADIARLCLYQILCDADDSLYPMHASCASVSLEFKT